MVSAIAPPSVGRSGHTGADRSRLYQDWGTEDLDQGDIWNADSHVLGGRSAGLVRNNAYARALLNAWYDGVVGPDGLRWQSLYRADPLAEDIPDDDRQTRRRINYTVRRALAHHRMDAEGLRTWRDMQLAALYSKALYGGAWAVRTMLPQRPGSPTHATCWRLIHDLRVSNPDDQPDTDRIRHGIELDANGTPVAIHVRMAHPSQLMADSAGHTWRRIPFWDARGRRQVIWYANRESPDQLRTVGWYAPVITLIAHLGKVQEAHVVAKRLQSCLGMIVETDDPVKAARADRNGVVLGRNTKIVPGRTYYTKRGSKITAFNTQYQGSDYAAFSDALFDLVCAGFGGGALPAHVVKARLDKASLAAARASLAQAWRSYRREHVALGEDFCRPAIASLIDEDLARGRLELATGLDLDAAAAGMFIPPQRLLDDDERVLKAAMLKRQLGVSRTTLARENGGYDLDEERQAIAEEESRDDDAGVAHPAGATPEFDDEPDTPPGATPEFDDEPDTPPGTTEEAA
jgi:capsid protein